MFKNHKKITSILIAFAITSLNIGCANTSSEPTLGSSINTTIIETNTSANMVTETHHNTEVHHTMQTDLSTNTSVAVENTIVNSQDVIGEEKAKTIALEHSGVRPDAVNMMWVELDRDNHRLEYDMEFYSGNMEYEVSVDAYTGQILEFSSEIHDGH